MPSSSSASTMWQDHLNKTIKKHPDRSPQECMQIASKTYKGSSSSYVPNPPPKPTKMSQQNKAAFRTASSKIAEAPENDTKEVLLSISSSLIELLRLPEGALQDKDMRSLISYEKKISALADQYAPESESESGCDDSENDY